LLRQGRTSLKRERIDSYQRIIFDLAELLLALGGKP